MTGATAQYVQRTPSAQLAVQPFEEFGDDFGAMLGLKLRPFRGLGGGDKFQQQINIQAVANIVVCALFAFTPLAQAKAV